MNEQRSLSFRDPEELRLARIAEFTSLREALDQSVTRSSCRKTVALKLFPPSADSRDPAGDAASRLAHTLGENHDKNFDINLVVPALLECTPDEQIDVVAFLLRALSLEVVDGRIRPKNRPSKEDEAAMLRKDFGRFANEFLARLDSVSKPENE